MSLTLIETKTVGAGGGTSIDFNAIPQGFTDLYILASTRANNGAVARNMNVKFNGSTSGYSEGILDSNGSAASSARTSGSLINWSFENDSASTANTFSNVSMYIFNYAGLGYKSFSINSSAENNATTGYNRLTSGVWANSSAITTLSLLSESGSTFVAGSTASLYGVKADTTIVQPKAIGGTTLTSGGYVYHVFRESGTFVALQSLNADVLMIGGGGGGGFSYGLGGGAGTVAATYNQALSGAKTVVVGYGGGPGYYGNGNGGNGYNGGATTFTGLPTAAGGAGGPQGGWNGGNGAGSGPSGQNGGAGTYGFVSWATATGTGYDNGFYGGGGGGGGYESYGMGGIGGGGNGGAYAFGMYGGNNGVYNTGSGGGGGYSGSGAGGSGLVIVRYLI